MHQKHNSQPAMSPISAVECLSYGGEILERFLDIRESALTIGTVAFRTTHTHLSTTDRPNSIHQSAVKSSAGSGKPYKWPVCKLVDSKVSVALSINKPAESINHATTTYKY